MLPRYLKVLMIALAMALIPAAWGADASAALGAPAARAPTPGRPYEDQTDHRREGPHGHVGRQ